MMYAHFWHGSAVQDAFSGVRDRTLSKQTWLVSCKDSPCGCFRHYEVPVWVQHLSVGSATARETAAAYYKSMAPARLEGITTIWPFQMTDHWHLGLTPANHIRRLSITVGRHHSSGPSSSGISIVF
jgi:hypothetical protein